MQHRPNAIPRSISRRSFFRTASVLAAGTPWLAGQLTARAGAGGEVLMAYVGTFSSPLTGVLPTQVDLPPGNGRGIHIFQVNRTNGALAACGAYEIVSSPSCLVLNAAGTCLYSTNETAGVGDSKEGTVSAFAINRTDGQLKLLNTVCSGGAGPI
jgi:6-phosphogluconolactonase (cycloisomerase 2 family)